MTTIHGMSDSPEYRIWGGIKQRCYNPNVAPFHRYGGRGIEMCDRWRDSFAAFFADVGPRPSPTHSIDRIDNDGNYEPSNVRWATKREQASNRWTHHCRNGHVRTPQNTELDSPLGRRRCLECLRARVPLKPIEPQPCGTDAAFQRHLFHSEEPCEACHEAHKATHRANYRRRRDVAQTREQAA